jgi:decaprenylphospho-beta-D-erythro-pentofuranosid-2-ulose 2-reductase
VALLGRDMDALQRAAQEVRDAGAVRVVAFELDALATERHKEILQRAVAELGGAVIVILAVGQLGARGGMPEDVPAAVELIEVNTVGAGSLLMHSSALLRDSGGGAIVVLSSVAAERPRRANAVYGASKAGLDALARGLGDDLEDAGVRVLVVRPGFVHTRMTAGLDPAPLATTPQAVAEVVLESIDGRAQTVWVPRPLRFLMFVLRALPRVIFRRMKQ